MRKKSKQNNPTLKKKLKKKSTCQLIPKLNILILKQMKLFLYTVQAAAKAYNTLHYKVQNPNYRRGTFFLDLCQIDILLTLNTLTP